MSSVRKRRLPSAGDGARRADGQGSERSHPCFQVTPSRNPLEEIWLRARAAGSALDPS